MYFITSFPGFICWSAQPLNNCNRYQFSQIWMLMNYLIHTQTIS